MRVGARVVAVVLASALATGAATATAEDAPQYGVAPGEPVRPLAPAPAPTVVPTRKATPTKKVTRRKRVVRPRTVERPRAVASGPTPTRAWTARVLHPVRTRTAPRREASLGRRLSPYAAYDDGPQTLLVLGARVAKDGVYYRVLIPERPNGSSAWVPAAAVRVRPTPWRVVVNLAERRAELRRAGRLVRRVGVAVGTPRNPTPRGLTAVGEIVRQPDPRGFYGPYIITLAAHSERLSDFDGGKGLVALHGTSRPDLLGRAVSHGCVRLPNAFAREVARLVPPGAPVRIV